VFRQSTPNPMSDNYKICHRDNAIGCCVNVLARADKFPFTAVLHHWDVIKRF